MAHIRYRICENDLVNKVQFKYRKVTNAELLLSKIWCDSEKLEETLINPLLTNKMKLAFEKDERMLKIPVCLLYVVRFKSASIRIW